MHRKLLVAGLTVAALVLAGCSSSDDTATDTASAEATTEAAEEATEEAAEEVTEEAAEEAAVTMDDSNCAAPENYCVGLVTDLGKVDDKSFNQAAFEGATLAAGELGAFLKYVESTDPKDYAANIGQFVDKEYDTIVTVGFLMAEASALAATENPNINFVGVDQFQGETLPNLTGLIFAEDQAGYAAGYLAGLMTETNKVGAVLGTDTVPPVLYFGEGYRNGVIAANPEAEVTVVYHEPANAFTDPEWGAAEAKKQVTQGADVVFGAGGGTGNGALIEIAKSPESGTSVFCIGVDIDQYFTVPQAQSCLLTSAEKKLVAGTSALVLASFDGTFPGGNFVGATGLAPYHDTEDAVPAEVKAEVEGVIAALLDGSLDTGVVK